MGHAEVRSAGIGPTDTILPIGMDTALSMARLGAEASACGGTPTKRASTLLPGVYHQLRAQPSPGARCALGSDGDASWRLPRTRCMIRVRWLGKRSARYPCLRAGLSHRPADAAPERERFARPEPESDALVPSPFQPSRTPEAARRVPLPTTPAAVSRMLGGCRACLFMAACVTCHTWLLTSRSMTSFSTRPFA